MIVEFDESLGISAQAVSKWESDASFPDILREKAVDIAKKIFRIRAKATNN